MIFRLFSVICETGEQAYRGLFLADEPKVSTQQSPTYKILQKNPNPSKKLTAKSICPKRKKPSKTGRKDKVIYYDD
jgi:hypothetical protein